MEESQDGRGRRTGGGEEGECASEAGGCLTGQVGESSRACFPSFNLSLFLYIVLARMAENMEEVLAKLALLEDELKGIQVARTSLKSLVM